MIGVILLAATQVAEPVAPPAETAAPLTSLSTFVDVVALDDGALARETARENLNQIASSNQAAQVTSNSINGPSVTGSVSFDGQAFSGFQGLSIVGANSGNNVAFNSSLNVNITIIPAR